MTPPTNQPPRSNASLFVGVVVAILLLGALTVLFSRSFWGSAAPLVVYCAHDSLFSEAVLREFEKQSGIPVAIRFDTEATKSLGLVNLLIREKEHPRCDVFWNNQVLGTMDLKQHGILLPYKGPGYERIPAVYKSADGSWVGFAARMRVYIVNTDKMPATSEAIKQALNGDLVRMAVAKPLYGTTRSHYTVLWDLWGEERLKQWHRDVRRRGVREVAGNATVKNLVAAGTCDFGWTDTDDFFVAQDDGKPVAMLPITVGTQETVCIPNTVAIIRGTKKLSQARQLVDYLLSADSELALARSKARQVPLGPIDDSLLPAEVKQLGQSVKNGYDLNRLEEARSECLDWLKSEYLR